MRIKSFVAFTFSAIGLTGVASAVTVGFAPLAGFAGVQDTPSDGTSNQMRQNNVPTPLRRQIYKQIIKGAFFFKPPIEKP